MDLTIDSDNSPSDCGHPNITPLSVKITHNTHQIGHVKAYRFNTAAMRKRGPAQFWLECQEYDNMHDGTKLDKIENVLENDEFGDWKTMVETAQVVLFVDEVVLDKGWRGQDLGLWAVAKLVQLQLAVSCCTEGAEYGDSSDALHLGESANRPPSGSGTVVMLQAGAVSRELAVDGEAVDEADEKLTRHWKRLGFEEWSLSDPAWLCVAGNKIKQAVNNLLGDD